MLCCWRDIATHGFRVLCIVLRVVAYAKGAAMRYNPKKSDVKPVPEMTAPLVKVFRQLEGPTMVKEDYEHLAQCCQSLRGCIVNHDGTNRDFDQDEFRRFIDRLVWAIEASPGGVSKDFDFNRFVRQCNGEPEPDKFPTAHV